MQKLAQHCNVKKEAALAARDQSSLLFLGTYLNRLANQAGKSVVYREAMVVAVDKNHVDVMVGELNMEKRVHLANLPVWRSEFDDTKQTLTMYWRKGVDTYTGRQQFVSDDEEDEGQDDYLDEELLLEEMIHGTARTSDNHQQSPLDDNSDQLETILGNREGDSAEKTAMKTSFLEHYAKKTMVANGTSDPAKNDTSIDDPAATPSSSPSSSPKQPESTKSVSMKRASLALARLSDSTGYSTEQGYQTVKALDKIRVALVVDMARTPPLIRILAVNPFA